MSQEENQKLKLPFSVSEIFGSNRKLALLHKNPLTNAESLIKKGQMKSALEIYTRTLTKVGDSETGKKISENIAKLKNYIKEFHPELDKNIQSKLNPAKTDNFSESLKEFSENLGDSLTEKLNILKQIETVPPEDEKKDFPYDLGKLSPNNFPKRSEAKESSPNIGSMNIDADSIEIDQANFATDNFEEKPVVEKQNKEKPAPKKKAEFKQTEFISDEEEIPELETESNSSQKEIIEEAEFYFSDELPLEEIEVKAEKVGKKFISDSEIRLEETRKEIIRKREINQDSNNPSEHYEADDSKTNQSLEASEKFSFKAKSSDSKNPIKENSSDSEFPVTSFEIPSSTEMTVHSFISEEESDDSAVNLGEPTSADPNPKINEQINRNEKANEGFEKKYLESESERIPNPVLPTYVPYFQEPSKSIPNFVESRKSDEASELKSNQENVLPRPIEVDSNPQKVSPSFGTVEPNQKNDSPKSNEIGSNINNVSSPSGEAESIQNNNSAKWNGTESNQKNFSPPPLIPSPPIEINELLSSLYYSNEFEKYHKLPTKNRRSGKDRRIVSKLNEAAKERRSGIDRRVVLPDLLKQREDYIREWQANIPKRNEPSFIPEDIIDSPYFSPDLNQMEFLPRELQNFKKPTVPTERLETLNLPLGDFTNEENQNQESFPKSYLPSESMDSSSLDAANRNPYAEPLVKIELPDPESSNILGEPTAESRNQGKEPSDNSKLENANFDNAKFDSAKFDKSNFDNANRKDSEDIPQKGKSNANVEDSETSNTPQRQSAESNNRNLFSQEEIELPKVELPEPKDYVRSKSGHLMDPFEEQESPEINMVDGDSPFSEEELPEVSPMPEAVEEPKEAEKIIHGVLELKPPEIDDAPFLTLTYDFSKIPHPFRLSKNFSIMEYSYYKYKPMLMKAQEFARRKMLKNALNYYRVIKSQNIPPELKSMITRNIIDITEFLEKFTMSKGG